MITVLTAGHINWDVTMCVDRLPEPDGEATIHAQHCSGGGSAANVAVALATLDVDSYVLGSVGSDTHGQRAIAELEAAGVSTVDVVTVSGQTSVKYLLVDERGEVSVLGTDGVNEALEPDDIDPQSIEAADYVHLTSQRPETAARIAEIASEASVPVSFDPGRRITDRDYSATFERADIVFATSRESTTIIERDAISAGCTVVVKYGSEGAKVRQVSGTVAAVSGFAIDPVDTTGAGDAFAAAFLETVSRRDHESTAISDSDTETLTLALERANACGALTARKRGPRGSPSREQLAAFLE